jgi:hypothetical protein
MGNARQAGSAAGDLISCPKDLTPHGNRGCRRPTAKWSRCRRDTISIPALTKKNLPTRTIHRCNSRSNPHKTKDKQTIMHKNEQCSPTARTDYGSEGFWFNSRRVHHFLNPQYPQRYPNSRGCRFFQWLFMLFLLGMACLNGRAAVIRIDVQGSRDGLNWASTGSSWTVQSFGRTNPVIASRFYSAALAPLTNSAPNGYVFCSLALLDGANPSAVTNELQRVNQWAIPTSQGTLLRARLSLVP